MKKLKYLIVGYGNIGHKRQAVLGKKCVATLDPDPKRNADYTKLESLPDNIYNSAVLTIPQQDKYRLVEYFLQKGKNVLVEKPLILTREQAKNLTQISQKNSCIWYTSFNHRFEPSIQKMQQKVRSEFLGKLYHAKFIYSFGNIKERIGTWRETQFGVLEEIAPHLIDFAFTMFNYKGKDFKTVSARRAEAKIYDHWLFSTTDDKVIFETSAVTWKNIFSLSVYGDRGSLFVNSLNKWGGSILTLHKRLLPSGAPKEKVIKFEGVDRTWKKDFAYFEKLLQERMTSIDEDIEMSIALANICLQAKGVKPNYQQSLYKEILKQA